ncbi:MAG: DUF4339 domain-containing protein [Flavobacteriaceae bacterium]|nr:DUF4339 domain-containing protein [Flavobacteriaceae bacterium]
MKEYYIILNDEQHGPYSIQDLKDKNLKKDTFVWCEGLDDWQKLEDTPDLIEFIKLSKKPPPMPSVGEKVAKTEVSGSLNIKDGNKNYETLYKLRPNKKILTFLLLWVSFNLFALVMSYSEVDVFNNSGAPQTEKLWPFVEFNECLYEYSIRYSNRTTWMKRPSYPMGGYTGNKRCNFNGIFTQYDWSEFALYVGGIFIIFIVIRVSTFDNIES